jgi:hypothetical protein
MYSKVLKGPASGFTVTLFGSPEASFKREKVTLSDYQAIQGRFDRVGNYTKECLSTALS